MPNVVSDILGGPVRIFHAPLSTTYPDESQVVGASWPAGWISVGFTKESLKLIYEFETEDWMIQESLGPVNRRKTSHSCRFETVLSEHTAASIQLAFGGELTTTPAGIGQEGFEQLDMGDVAVLDTRIWGFEGSYVDEAGDTFPVILIVHKATAQAGGELEYGRESGYTGIPLQIAALSDFSQSTAAERLFKLIRTTDEATA